MVTYKTCKLDYFKLLTCALKPQEAGAVAHMSLHLFNNVKEPPTKIPDTTSTPNPQAGRYQMSVQCGDRWGGRR